MERQIVLGRVGHYFDAGNGSCSTAIVTETFGPEGEEATAVNVAAWNHGATSFSRTSVPIDGTPDADAARANSFHLNRDCPWAR